MRERREPKPKPEWIVILRLARGGPAAFQDLVDEGVLSRREADSARHALLRARFIEPHASRKTSGQRGRPRVEYRLAEAAPA